MANQDRYDDEETTEPVIDANLNPASHLVPGAIIMPPETLDPSRLAALGKALDGATPLMRQGSEYLDFVDVGTEVRAIYRGMSTYTKEDGTVVPKALFATHDKDNDTWKMWHHSGAVLVRQLEGLPIDTAIAIKYTGTKKHTTKTGATIKLYEVTVLQAPSAATAVAAAWDGARIAKARAYFMPLTANEKGGLAKVVFESADKTQRRLETLNADQVATFRRGCAMVFDALVKAGKDEASGNITGAVGDDIQLLVASLNGIDVIEKTLADSAPPF